jgi:hypothetical protein
VSSLGSSQPCSSGKRLDNRKLTINDLPRPANLLAEVAWPKPKGTGCLRPDMNGDCLLDAAWAQNAIAAVWVANYNVEKVVIRAIKWRRHPERFRPGFRHTSEGKTWR